VNQDLPFDNDPCGTTPRITRRALLAAAGSVLAAAASSSSLAADTWPSRAVTIIVPYPAGGVVDVVTRSVAAEMSNSLKQPFVIMNKTGANGNIAADTVLQAEPDGYTLLASGAFLVTNPHIEAGLRWQRSSFTPIARLARSADYLVVPVNSPHRSVKAYVEAARHAPQPLQYGIAGPGTPQALANEILKRSANIQLEAIAYQGAPPIVTDLVTERLTMAVLPALVALPQIRAGKLRALATLSDRRTAELPDVPTVAEAGFPEPTIVSWYGLHAPAKTPPAVVAALGAAAGDAFRVAAVRERLVQASTEPAYLNAAEFGRFLESEDSRWSRVARQMKTK
jgi:tripartite-type tricarboxylate transporter receptor subunit TctC